MPGKGTKSGLGDRSAHRGMPESRGRSASSPGHLKKEAGLRSAESFAPGHDRRVGPSDRRGEGDRPDGDTDQGQATQARA